MCDNGVKGFAGPINALVRLGVSQNDFGAHLRSLRPPPQVQVLATLAVPKRRVLGLRCLENRERRRACPIDALLDGNVNRIRRFAPGAEHDIGNTCAGQGPRQQHIHLV